MVSTYQYITVADLEKYTGKDYDTLKTGYTDTVIESWITQSERFVNVICQASYSVTIPDHVVSATLLIASRIARNRIMDDGFLEEDFKEKRIKEPLIDGDVYALLGLPYQSGFAARGTQGSDA